MTSLGHKAQIVFMSALSGAIVLGVFSRVIMAAIALLFNKPTNLSLSSFAEVTMVGTILGVVGGLFLLGIRKKIQPGIYRGVTLGLFLYAGSLVLGMMGQYITLSENTDAIVTFVLVGGVYALYGILTEWLLLTIHDNHKP